MRIAGCTSLLVFALTAWTRHEARKEHVQLQLSTQSGNPARVRVITRGLFLIMPELTVRRQPWQVITTVSAPTQLTLAGIGEADIRLADSSASLFVQVTQVREGASPVQRLRGRSFRVSRATFTEPYRVTALENLPVSDRR
jgi:hypothetical protein